MEILTNQNLSSENPMMLGVMGKNKIDINDDIICEAIICCFYKQGLLTEKEYAHIMDSLAIGKAM